MNEPKKRMIYSDDIYNDQKYLYEAKKEYAEANEATCEIDFTARIAKTNVKEKAEEIRGTIGLSIDGIAYVKVDDWYRGFVETVETWESDEAVRNAFSNDWFIWDIETVIQGSPTQLEDWKNRFETWISDNRQEDWNNELATLRETLGDSELLVFGSIGRWDGAHTGWEVKSSFDEIVQETMKDCEGFEIWDENGHLYVEGIHHDGRNIVEVRMMTETGNAYYCDWVDRRLWCGDLSESNMLEELKRPEYSELPRHAERAFGCPAEEYQSIERTATSLSSETKDARNASNVLGNCGADEPSRGGDSR